MAKSPSDWRVLTIRMPRAIYDQIIKIAERTHRSLSAAGLTLVEKALAERKRKNTDV